MLYSVALFNGIHESHGRPSTFQKRPGFSNFDALLSYRVCFMGSAKTGHVLDRVVVVYAQNDGKKTEGYLILSTADRLSHGPTMDAKALDLSAILCLAGRGGQSRATHLPRLRSGWLSGFLTLGILD